MNRRGPLVQPIAQSVLLLSFFPVGMFFDCLFQPQLLKHATEKSTISKKASSGAGGSVRMNILEMVVNLQAVPLGELCEEMAVAILSTSIITRRLPV